MSATTCFTIRQHLEAATISLAAAGIETPRIDAEWLLAALLGVERLDLCLASDRELSDGLAEGYRVAVGRRTAREPLQQILGRQAFRSISVTVTPEVLVPRPETEVLTAWALELLPSPAGDGVGIHRPLVIDLGTGSGCIACALASERMDIDVIATEIAPAAARVAQRNVDALGFAGRVRVVVGDLLAPLGGARADLIVSNPPYLVTSVLPTLAAEVRVWEPRGALDGGQDGLAVIRRIIDGARAALRSSGALVLETGGPAQMGEVARLLGAAGFADVAVRRDLAGVARFIAGRA